MPQFVSSQEICKVLDCERQFIHVVSRREGWRKKDYNRPYWYNLEDVQEYFYNREHSRISREQGLKFRGMLRHMAGYHPLCLACNQEK